MAIPEHVINTIKSRVNLVDWIQKTVKLKKTGGNYVGLCPFHSEKSPSFTVNDSKQFYHCFGCGAHGDVIDWLMDHEGMPWRDAVARLGALTGVELPEKEHSQRAQAKASVSEILNKAARWMHQRLVGLEPAGTTENPGPEVRKALEFVYRERGLKVETTHDFLIGYAPTLFQDYANNFNEDELKVLCAAGVLGLGKNERYYPKMAGRIIFPIRDASGGVVGFAGRVLGNGLPKYMNSPDSSFFNKRTELFRAPGLRQATRQAGKVVVVEGYFDVTALYQADIRYAAATMGTATTTENLESLFALSKHVVFCFDGDRAGQAAAWKALVTCLPALGQGRLVSFMFLPEDLDPDDFIKKEGADAFNHYLSEAKPLSRFMLEHYENQLKDAPMEKYSGLLAESGEQLALIKEPVMREALVAEMAQLFRVPENLVRKAGKFNLATLTLDLSLPHFVLEKSLLSQLLRQPKEVHLLPEDVGLEMPGGNEILQKLRIANQIASESASGINLGLLFMGTPYWTLVQQLMEPNGPEENLGSLIQKVELAWIAKSMKAEMSTQNAAVYQQRIAQLAARKFEVMRRQTPQKNTPLSQGNRGAGLRSTVSTNYSHFSR